jgi:hypothetical protein
MWRAKFPFQKVDCSPNGCHIDAVLATDRGEHVTFNQVDE